MLQKIITTIFAFTISASFSQTKIKTGNNEGKIVTIYTSADSTNLRLTPTGTTSFITLRQPFENQSCIFVNPKKTLQTFEGIGGAITDASAEVFARLSSNQQAELINAYYSKDKGIGYSLIRTNINSCDFSSDMYTYVADNDTSLQTFSIEHDRKYKIPMIKKALQVAGTNTKLFASPWSPPAYMKDNNSVLQGGKLLPKFYTSWAKYYVQFIDHYQKEGIPIWGLTIQNEPMAKQRWESCIYTAEEERDFLKNYLGPTLKKAGMGDKKIIVWDHNRDLMTQRANVILEDPKASQYVYAVGFHWYENWSGGEPMFQNVAQVKKQYPNKNVFFTEGCNEKFDSSKYQLWANGERYGKSMIHDFNNGTVAWTDWNILLDENGGPNHVGNFCFAPIHANTKSGSLIYTPSYYFIGHFSKFIQKKAQCISTVSSRSSLLSTSFLNQDGSIITVVMNQSAKKITYQLCINSSASEITILPHAIQTLVY